MKVYAVEMGFSYEEGYTLGIFSAYALAEMAIQDSGITDDYDYISIVPYVIDGYFNQKDEE